MKDTPDITFLNNGKIVYFNLDGISTIQPSLYLDINSVISKLDITNSKVVFNAIDSCILTGVLRYGLANELGMDKDTIHNYIADELTGASNEYNLGVSCITPWLLNSVGDFNSYMNKVKDYCNSLIVNFKNFLLYSDEVIVTVDTKDILPANNAFIILRPVIHIADLTIDAKIGVNVL